MSNICFRIFYKFDIFYARVYVFVQFLFQLPQDLNPSASTYVSSEVPVEWG